MSSDIDCDLVEADLCKIGPEDERGRRLITAGRLDHKQASGARSLRTESVKEFEVSQFIAKASNDAEADARCSYLPLSPNRSRKRRKLSNTNPATNRHPDILQEDHAQHGPDRFAGGQDLDSLSTSSGSELDPTHGLTDMNSARARDIQLSRLIEENPSDVDAWLAFIQHQNTMLTEELSGQNGGLTRAQQHGLAEVKSSMYEKALVQTKGQAAQDRLVLSMMAERAKIWETNKLVKQWTNIMKQYPDSIRLWLQYLTFQQTSFMIFNSESCRESFLTCLNMITNKQTSAEIERTRTFVFLRMTMFMREAGYSEQAYASWQAMLEYTYFEPRNDQADNELISFEDFWDSEVPRIGEERAQGWRSSKRVNIEPSADSSLLPAHDRHLFDTWIQHESQRMMASVLPARTVDAVDEDDPFRMILFSDIQPFLFRPSGIQPRQQLLEAFLCFCGLPSRRLDLSINTSLLEDPFLSYTSSDTPHKTLDKWLLAAESHPYGFPMPSFLIDTTSLFAWDERWFSAWNGLPSVLSNNVRGEWIQRSLRQLQTAFPEDELFAEYVLAFESQLNIKEARKYAKSLLKQQPSIRLYNVFALLEHTSGQMEAAERVWSTALSMQSSFPKTSQRATILIWRSWLWAVLDDKDLSKALRLCLAVPDETIGVGDLAEAGSTYLEGHPTRKLRAQQYLVSRLEQCLSVDNQDLAIHYLDVLGLFTYLTSNQNLALSLKHYTSASSHPTIAQSPSTLSLLHQSQARLLHFHASTSSSGFRPSDITTPLAESIRLFPNNTIFLSLYHFHTRRSLLIDRIRDVLPSLTLSSAVDHSYSNPTAIPQMESIIPSLFHIYNELHRPTFAGTTSHSIRAAFEHALSSSDSPSHHSPTIWTLYLHWEIHVASASSTSTSTLNPMARAISILHRALRACPWCKDLYLLAFRLPAQVGRWSSL